MRKRTNIVAWVALLLVAAVLCGACSSSVNMHKHKRSDCDCPRFD